MNKAKLTIMTQGVKGGSIKYLKEQGFIAVTMDGIGRISANSFVGLGDSYHKRDEVEIVVYHQTEIIFEGTATKFMECLKLGLKETK